MVYPTASNGHWLTILFVAMINDRLNPWHRDVGTEVGQILGRLFVRFHKSCNGFLLVNQYIASWVITIHPRSGS